MNKKLPCAIPTLNAELFNRVKREVRKWESKNGPSRSGNSEWSNLIAVALADGSHNANIQKVALRNQSPQRVFDTEPNNSAELFVVTYWKNPDLVARLLPFIRKWAKARDELDRLLSAPGSHTMSDADIQLKLRPKRYDADTIATRRKRLVKEVERFAKDMTGQIT